LKAKRQNANKSRRVKVKSIERQSKGLTKKEQQRVKGGAAYRGNEDLAASKPTDESAKQTNNPTASERQPMGF
jgi:hypothetical protein